MYTIPRSRENETIPVPTTLRHSLSCLDVVWSDMFETEAINPDRARQHQIDFLRGAPPKWQNFSPNLVPLVKRDGFNDLVRLVEKRKAKRSLIADVSLEYQPGSGGSTLGMQVLWHFRKDLRCARAIESDTYTNENVKILAKQAVDLFLLSNEPKKQDRRTVLLLLDTKKKMDNDLPIKNVLWENLIEEIQKRNISTDTPVVIILCCNSTDFTLTDKLICPSNLSEEETRQFKDKLVQQIRLQRKSHRKVTTINLFYHENSCGSKTAREVLSYLKEEFACEIREELVKTDNIQPEQSEEEIKDIASRFGTIHIKEKKTVLLLLDHKEEPRLHYLLKNLLKLECAGRPAFIVINAVSKSAPRKSDHVKLKMELLPDEKKGFAEKKLELYKAHKKLSHTFHAFNIMQGGFQIEDAEKIITEKMINHIENDPTSTGTTLLSFLALINSYVPGSSLLNDLCRQFIAQTKWPNDGKRSLGKTMESFWDLIVIFSEGEPKTKSIRLAHPMIADACLRLLQKHNVTKSDIASDFLNSMVETRESSFVQICKSMLLTRLDGPIELEKFSKLILDILDDGNDNVKQCIGLLERALNLFSTDPFYPQALARLYYIEAKDDTKYEKAKKWAVEAIERDQKKSYVIDTLGQVFKNQLLKERKDKEKGHHIDIAKCSKIKECAIKAFNKEAEAAKVESEKFNNRGYFGYLQVCNVIFDIGLEQENIMRHRDDVESRYDFFEWYLAFSKPSINKEEPEYLPREVQKCYERYFRQGNEDAQITLKKKKHKSFAGLFQCKNPDINLLNLQDVHDEKQVVLYVLANIILNPSDEHQDLQDRLIKLWETNERDRRPEFYLLILFVFWSDEIADSQKLEKCVQYMSQSYKREYEKYLRNRYLVPLFFLGNGSGLKRLVHGLPSTDVELLTEGDEHVSVDRLQRIVGKVENHKVFAVRNGLQIQVTPHKLAGVYKEGRVTFYLGCTIQGPVAYNIRYDENCK